MNFGIKVQEADAATLVHLAGELDLASRDRLTECVRQLIHAGQCRLRLDLRELTFCDSSGISALVRSKYACVEANGFLDVVGSAGQVARVLDVAGVRTFLEGR